MTAHANQKEEAIVSFIVVLSVVSLSSFFSLCIKHSRLKAPVYNFVLKEM
jgi:hypothetical protein